MKYWLVILISILSLQSSAQNIGIGTSSPDSSAALHISDTTKGILIPRMSMNQRTGIHNPAEGLLVYQTDNTKGFWYFDGSGWIELVNSLHTAELNTIIRRLQTQHYINH